MTTITSLPPAPSRSDPTTFSDRSDALLGAFDQFVTETNTVAGEVNANAIAAAASASDATDQVTLAAAQVTLAAAQVTLATTQADAAEASATAAAQASNAALWVSGTSYVIGNVAISPIDFQAYRRKTNGAGTTDPSADSTNWTATAAGIANVVTATTATTLTSTPTLLQITPTGYGVAVTLPDATTCSEGGPLHIIDNKGAYPVRVLNSAGVLKGFVFGGVVSHVSLVDNSSAAGTWTIENSELVGASAQLLTTNMALIDAVIDLGGNREALIGRGVSSANCYGVVYNRETNTFGSVTLIRTATFGASRIAACLSATDQILVVSCANAATSFEAVVLSISGTTITVNTAATATLSANISGFGHSGAGAGVIAVGASFVTSYTVATPAAQLRALSISGTTVTIGSATALSGVGGGQIVDAGSSIVLAASINGPIYVRPYTVSGSTLSAGTGATPTATGTATLRILTPLGSRWFLGYDDATDGARGAVLSISGTTVTSSSVVVMSGAGTQCVNAILIDTSKVLMLSASTSLNANILTDTAGTASAGTAITINDQISNACLYVSGTTVAVWGGLTAGQIHTVSCAGSSPVLLTTQKLWSNSDQYAGGFLSPNGMLVRGANAVYSGDLAQTIAPTTNATTSLMNIRVRSGEVSTFISPIPRTTGGDRYRGRVDSERWSTDAATVIYKLECAV